MIKGCTGIALTFLMAASLPVFALDAGEEKDREEKLKAGDRDDAFLLRVNNTVRDGMQYILDIQAGDGSFPDGYDREWPGGASALCLLALLKSGVPRHDPAIEKGFAFLKKTPLAKTYSVAIALMALEARWAPQKKVEERIKGHTRAVAAGPKNMPKGDIDWMTRLAKFLLKNKCYGKYVTQGKAMTGKKDAWSYPRDRSGDHSNTQYAILGLRSAHRCGVKVSRDQWEKTWMDVIDHFLSVQEKKGPKVRQWKIIEDKKYGYVSYKPVTSVPAEARGWTYGAAVEPKGGSRSHTNATTGSMTTVGVASLLIGMEGLYRIRSAKLKARKPKIERAAKDGLAWLAHHFTVETNPGHHDGDWLYYYLYGMERAAVLAGARNLGKHDWYREGAEFLMANQDGDGRWTYCASCGDIAPTCFALLFLTKATVPGRVKITR
ncbi:MAG: hypothetical protein ACYS47_15945 [Planctomycetota bacterium]|jgi:hypothetical protein